MHVIKGLHTMKIKRSQLRKIISESLLSEGRAKKLLETYPELQIAYDSGIRTPQYLQWIATRRMGEPVADVVGVVKAFEEKSALLKSRGKSTDIYAYKNPGELRRAIEDVGESRSSERRRLREEETTDLGQFGDWIVVMPHTQESSCQLGAGTTWCTAATESMNLFLSYVGSADQDIVLYYLIKIGANPRQDPNAKLSVGFLNGEPALDGYDGGISVNAANRGLTEEDLYDILDEQFEPIMRAMKSHSASIGGRHPAKRKMMQISRDPDAFETHTRGMDSEHREEFIKSLLQYNPSVDVLEKLIDISGSESKIIIAGKKYTNSSLLDKLSQDQDHQVLLAVSHNENTRPDTLMRLAQIDEDQLNSNIIRNPNANEQVLRFVLSNNTYRDDWRIRGDIATHENTTPDMLSDLSRSTTGYILNKVASNPKTPIEDLLRLLQSADPWRKMIIEDNPTYKAYADSQNQLQEKWLKISGLLN